MNFAEATGITALALAAASGGTSIYAVIIGRRALNWEKARAQTAVRVQILHSAAERPLSFINLDRPFPEPEKFYELEIGVINGGETTEFIQGLYVTGPDDGEGYELEADSELKPHSRVVTSMARCRSTRDLCRRLYCDRAPRARCRGQVQRRALAPRCAGQGAKPQLAALSARHRPGPRRSILRSINQVGPRRVTVRPRDPRRR